jgi:hypothetical protein
MKYGLVGVKTTKKTKVLKEESEIEEQPEKPKIKRLTYTKKAN